MQSVSHFRCFNHASREAAARCPICGNCFCRECVTEHEDRLVCAGCLKNAAVSGISNVHLTRYVLGMLTYTILAIFLSWYFFYCIGRILLRIPSTFSSLINTM